MRILLIFIDGFGIGPQNPKINPILAANTPTFDRLFLEEASIVIPTDTTQGVPGIPQSATGQTALLTGVHAAQIVKHHVSGFPGPKLREIITEKNILKQGKELGKNTTFANAYTKEYVESYYAGKIKGSVTTVCTDSAGLKFRYTEQIYTEDAVYQDFTNQILISQGLDLPLFSPERAGKILAKIVTKYDLTLYEFFQTDFIGHSQNMEKAVKVIEDLDRFINQVLCNLDLSETLVIISSDHGNIEDLSMKQHTKNPIPTILIGNGKEKIANRIKELADITPALLSLLK